MKRTEDSLRDLCDNIKCTSIQIIEVPEELRNKHAKTNNTIIEIKKYSRGINSRISEAEE